MQMSKEEQAAFAHFSRDIARHEMTVLLDNGVYRHILFKRRGDSSYHFELVTYPGYLCFSGDMGCYVFSRLHDMVSFFRSSGHEKSASDAPAVPNINPSYWAEKLQAVDGRRKAGFEEFSSEAFEQVVKEQLVQWWRDYPALGREGRAELRRQIQWEVLDKSNDGEHEAVKAGIDFSEEVEGIRFQFDEFWDHDFTRYTHSFLWACFAIAWGVHRYDEYKAAQAQLYYLQDTRSFVGNCPMFWKAGGGYTSNLDEAERMSLDVAMRQHAGRDTDLPWLCTELDQLRRATMDHQYFPRKSAEQAQSLAEAAARLEVAT